MKRRPRFLSNSGIRSRLLILVAISSFLMALCLFLIIQSITIKKVDEEMQETSELLLFVLDWTLAPMMKNNDTLAIQRLFENVRTEHYITHLRLFDPQYNILASSVLDEVGEVCELACLEDLFDREQLFFREINENAFISAIPVRGPEFNRDRNSDVAAVIYLELNREAYMQSFRGFISGTLLSSFGAIALIGIIILVSFSRWVTQPLKLLQRATNEIANGNYDVDVRIVQPLEFEKFSEIFNRMINELQLKERKISDYSESLEEKVRGRTEELADSISQLKQAQKTLIQQEKMASIGKLAAGVAHEINNPTGFIISNLQTLEEYVEILCRIIDKQDKALSGMSATSSPEHENLMNQIARLKEKEDLAFIISDIPPLLKDSQTGAYRISEIVRGLQSFSREDMGERSDEDVNEAIESALKIVWNRLKYKCDINKNLEDLPLIPCNRNQLEQVFVNLLVNAADAIEEKGVVTIDSRVYEDMVELRFHDTGAGMSENTKDNLFVPFFTTKDVGKGTGLGLSISHSIIENHHGNIEVESTPGKGTTFIIRLPLNTGVV